jgi:hypothetical protein
MRSALFVILFSITALLMAQAGYSSFGEAFSLREGQERLDVGSRQHTAPSLTEIQDSGVLVDWLEVFPTEIRVAVGETYSLNQFRVTAYGPDGVIQEHVPLSLDLEGPPGLLDFERWRVHGDTVLGAIVGIGTIWVTSLAPSSSGEQIKQPILLVVY